MARQEAQSKLLYYPTPLSVVDFIAPWLQVTPGSYIRLADPCVGQGEALAALANALRPAAGRVETWGVELSPARAEKAAGRIGVVLPTSFYTVQWSPASVSLLFNNPPYDWSSSVDDQGRKIRHEVLFAGQATPRLAPGGVHILIVPQRILGEEQLARHWCGWYTRTLAFRFPEADYQAFGQVVLIGVRRERFQMPTKAQMEGFLACGREESHLPPLDDCEPDGRYRLPDAPAKVRFAYTPLSDEEMMAAAGKVNLLGSPDWERATYVRPIGAPIFPLTQIKLGHLSMLISAGELGVVQLQTPEGPALVKGMLQKYRVRDTRNNHDDKGRVRSISIEEKEKLASVITLVKADGERRNVTGTREVGDFIRQYAGPLADAVLAKNRPFYNWDPTPTEMAVVNRCGLGLPPLPGRSERGLFEIQKHFAIAAKRKLRAGGHVIAMSEMGFGKTATAIAALELNNRWPALVLCPNHMPHKWRRELETASDPADPIQARHITRPARAEVSWFIQRIAPVLSEYGAELVSDERWQVSPISDNDPGGRRRLTIKVDAARRQDCLRRLEQAMLIKAGRQISQRPRVQLTLDGFTIEGLDRDDYTLADFFRDCASGAWRIGARAGGALDTSFDEDLLVDETTAIGGAARVGDKVLVRYTVRPDGALYAREIRPCVPKSHALADDELIVYVRSIRTRLSRKAVAIVTFDPAKYDAGPLPVTLPHRWTTVHYETNGKTKHARAKAPACPVCGGLFGVTADGELAGFLEKGPAGREVHVVLPDRCPHLHQEPMLDERGQVVKGADGSPLLATRQCNTALYTMSRWRRVGVARLVQRQYAHRFQVYICDEVHESKSADTDIGVADGRLLSGIRSSLALTGTLFGGAASSLFYLLYRRNPDVRQLYGYKDVDQWVDHYGLWKHQWDEAAEGTERGASSGITRWNVRPPQELPGVSPGVARFLLPITLFGKITDLGYQLPPLHDRVDLVGMGPALEPHYKGFSEKLLKKAIQRLRQDRDPGLLTVWFATSRYRPMSAFRDEDVIYQGEPILPLPAVVFDERDHLPKERRLAELVRASRACGRKTLVFVEQTGTRDIRSRLVETLDRLVPGANVQMLSATDMKPAKRELWIKRHAPAMDVLLVNAGLVKTGLDLVMFNDLVFYETNASLYVTWQAMRRVWRLGQKRPVTTTFLAYRGAMEAQLLELMGQKMKAAMLLYGDDAAGALVDTDTDEDLARELIRRALDGKTIDTAGDINGQALFGDEPAYGEALLEAPQAEPLPVSDWPMPEPVAPAEAIGQLSLFGGLVAVEVKRRRR